MKYSQFFRKCQTKVKKILTSICICSVLLTGCNAEAEAETEVKEIIEYNGSCADSCEYEHVVAIDFVSQENWTEGRFFALDTFIQVRVYDESEDRAKQVIHDSVHEIGTLEDHLSRHKIDSDVYRINEHAGQKVVQVSPHTLKLIEKSKAYYNMTNGLFDITLEPVISLWGDWD